MSKPLVPWTQDAETELTRIDTDNPEQRSQITAAANAIDRQLSSRHSRLSVVSAAAGLHCPPWE